MQLFEERSACHDCIHTAAGLRFLSAGSRTYTYPYRRMRLMFVLKRYTASRIRVVMTGEDYIRAPQRVHQRYPNGRINPPFARSEYRTVHHHYNHPGLASRGDGVFSPSIQAGVIHQKQRILGINSYKPQIPEIDIIRRAFAVRRSVLWHRKRLVPRIRQLRVNPLEVLMIARASQ